MANTITPVLTQSEKINQIIITTGGGPSEPNPPFFVKSITIYSSVTNPAVEIKVSGNKILHIKQI